MGDSTGQVEIQNLSPVGTYPWSLCPHAFLTKVAVDSGAQEALP